MAAAESVSFSGLIISIQPRIMLTRSFDERTHTYLGYVLLIRGSVGAAERDVLVAIGPATHAELGLRAGDRVRGRALPVKEPRREIAELYKVSGLEVLERGALAAQSGPLWQDVPFPLPIYRERGHRRLDAKAYERTCYACMWGCRMPVEMIVDQWSPEIRRYREETFCYGPLSCSVYRAGP
ncbi:MAG: hypothetical protein M3Z65_04845, partial [Chloroflexota bacterium]|nr:hypothetical protein [Chloroflexota bacterium]